MREASSRISRMNAACSSSSIVARSQISANAQFDAGLHDRILLGSQTTLDGEALPLANGR